MLAAQENNLQSMEKEDIHYPIEDEVADDEVYDKFLQLQIPREPIDLVSNDDDKKDDDDDHHDPKSSGKDEADPKDSTKPPPSTSPPKDGRDKGKGIAEGSSQSPPPSTSPPKVMEAAMKEKAHSSFVANPLIGLPNEVPMSTQIIAGKDTDPYIEIYPLSKLPTLPHHTLLHHCALLQKALNAALGFMEVLRLSNKDLEEEHDRMKHHVTTGDNDLVCVTHQLLQAQQKLEKAPTKSKRATKGAAAKQQSKAKEQMETWKKSFQTLYDKCKENQTQQDLDQCNTKVQELQDQLQREQ